MWWIRNLIPFRVVHFYTLYFLIDLIVVLNVLLYGICSRNEKGVVRIMPGLTVCRSIGTAFGWDYSTQKCSHSSPLAISPV